MLALFGELDNNILAEKNRAAWEAALKSGGHRDYTLRLLPQANHGLLEAKVGNNAEMKSLQRSFLPTPRLSSRGCQSALAGLPARSSSLSSQTAR